MPGETVGAEATALLDAALGRLADADPRPGQREMVRRIAAAVAADEHLLVQAGTGTGKSLAYLAAVLAAGGGRRRRVLVTTATKALQAQLLDSDLPRVAAAVRARTGRQLAVAVAKGRSNYLCLERVHAGSTAEPGLDLELEQGPRTAREEAVARLRAWAGETETGDRDDVGFAIGDSAWAAVSVSGRDCLGARCSFREDCFAELARAAAAEADVVVANHALLAVDLRGDAQVLPERDVVVLDEAHDLEAFVTEAFSAEVSEAATARTVRLASALLPEADRAALAQALTDVAGLLPGLPAGLLPGLPPAARTVLASVQRAAESAAGRLAHDLAEEGPPAEPGQARDLRARAALRELGDSCNELLRESEHQALYVVREPADAPGRLRVSPLLVAGQLADRLFARTPVIATSATLLVDGSPAHLARAFGLDAPAAPPATDDQEPAAPAADEPAGRRREERRREERREPRRWSAVDVGSPFDYAHQAQLYVAAHLPDPARAGQAWAEAVDAEIVALVRAAGGRTLALFSSTRAAARAAATVRAQLPDVPVLMQGDDTPARLRWRFAGDARTCLFGTRGLWHGFDVAGSACQLVVIDRIPFPSPEEPLTKARSLAAEAAGVSGFAAVSVPAAAVPLAQAVGRLVRARADRGVVAVLDPRLATKPYGARLLRSLPPMWQTRDGAQVLASLAAIDVAAPPIRPVGPEPAQARRESARQAERRTPSTPSNPRRPAPEEPPARDANGLSENDRALLAAGVRAGRSLRQLAARHEMTEPAVLAAVGDLGLTLAADPDR